MSGGEKPPVRTSTVTGDRFLQVYEQYRDSIQDDEEDHRGSIDWFVAGYVSGLCHAAEASTASIRNLLPKVGETTDAQAEELD